MSPQTNMEFHPFQRMKERLKSELEDSDLAYFHGLLLFGELQLKCVTLSLVSGVSEDKARHKYRLISQLVRANGLGDWRAAVQEALNGPSAQFLDPELLPCGQELTERVSEGAWQHSYASTITKCLQRLGITSVTPTGRLSAVHGLEAMVVLRNKTRAHGAFTSAQLAPLCTPLAEALETFATNAALFRLPWAYVKRNLSGKYRVSPIGGDKSKFAGLTRGGAAVHQDGVYLWLSRPCHVELVRSDPDLRDFFVANGAFNEKSYEMLSYASGDKCDVDAAPYLLPADSLPSSETEGLGTFDMVGRTFTNVPTPHTDYVKREQLEKRLQEQLALDRHPIITLSGPGGIGKTSLALTVINDMLAAQKGRYDLVVWFSARDIDLLPEGPKTVRPAGVTLKDFGQIFSQLIDTPDLQNKKFNPVEFLARHMSKCDFGPTLFVFDNFETVANPSEVFTWIDTHIRPPNKVLITTRITKEFAADFPVPVGGMDDVECLLLVTQLGDLLGISSLLSDAYKQELVSESDGHPYVIKVILGQVAREGATKKIERMVASHDEVLAALFERTFAALKPGAQRVFLTLANWRSTVPRVGLEAVLLRPDNERFDVQEAIDELVRSSLVEEIRAADGSSVLNLPLAAELFGRKKLSVSQWKLAVEADSEILRAFGASQRSDDKSGLSGRVYRFMRDCAEGVAHGRRSLPQLIPVLEYLCRRHYQAWRWLAEFYLEVGQGEYERVKECYRRFLEEGQKVQDEQCKSVWRELATLCRSTGDTLGELHALMEIARQANVTTGELSSAANRVNGILHDVDTDTVPGFGRDERRALVSVIAERMKSRLDELNGVDCSRLAWLYFNLDDGRQAYEIACVGVQQDPDDMHCARIVARLKPRYG